jgi:hypothetical protein
MSRVTGSVTAVSRIFSLFDTESRTRRITAASSLHA